MQYLIFVVLVLLVVVIFFQIKQRKVVKDIYEEVMKVDIPVGNPRVEAWEPRRDEMRYSDEPRYSMDDINALVQARMEQERKNELEKQRKEQERQNYMTEGDLRKLLAVLNEGDTD